VFGSTGTREPEGLSLDFAMCLFEAFLPYAVGMDISEVNFSLAKDEEEKEKDLETFIKIVQRVKDIVTRLPARYHKTLSEQDLFKNEESQQMLDALHGDQQVDFDEFFKAMKVSNPSPYFAGQDPRHETGLGGQCS
jgi:hypothetical protein